MSGIGGFTKASALGVDERRTYMVIDFAVPSEACPTLADGYRVDARVAVATLDHSITNTHRRAVRRWGRLGDVCCGRWSGREPLVPLLRRAETGAAVRQARAILLPTNAIPEGARVRPR